MQQKLKRKVVVGVSCWKAWSEICYEFSSCSCIKMKMDVRAHFQRIIRISSPSFTCSDYPSWNFSLNLNQKNLLIKNTDWVKWKICHTATSDDNSLLSLVLSLYLRWKYGWKMEMRLWIQKRTFNLIKSFFSHLESHSPCCVRTEGIF